MGIKFKLIMLTCLFVLVGVLAFVVASDHDVKYVKFDVKSLNDDESGSFYLKIERKSAPLGFDRFVELVESDFFTGVRFFRNFVTQFGISGDPKVADHWRSKKIQDDPVIESNLPKSISFATSGPNTRTTQLFINLGDNARLDGMGFAPFGTVVKGWNVVQEIFMGYKEAPAQGRIQAEGNSYLQKHFPRLTYISKASFVHHDEL